MALSALDKNEEALGALERALRIKPDYADARRARASVNSKLGIDLDEEEKAEEEKPKVKKSIWTKRKPTSKIMKKYPGQGREKKGERVKKSEWARKEQKTVGTRKNPAKGKEKKK